MLNLVLQDLVMHRNLKVNLITSTIIIPPNSYGPFNLESNYLRTYDMFYTVSGTPYFLNACSLKEIDNENYQSGLASYPYEWASDLSGVPTVGYGVMYIYPATGTQLSVTHRYYNQQPDISAPESSNTVPWFSDQDYLTVATATRLMRFTDDERYPLYVQECDRLLENHLMTEGDEQQVVKEVILDPRRFRVGGSNRPTKLDPF